MRKQVSPPDTLDSVPIMSRKGPLAVRSFVMSHVYPCAPFPSGSWAPTRSDSGSLTGPFLLAWPK